MKLTELPWPLAMEKVEDGLLLYVYIEKYDKMSLKKK